MTLRRPNPIALDVVGSIDVSIDDDLQRLVRQIENAEGSRRAWVSKQRLLLEQRRGIRKKKVVPWPGANNDNWPLTDAIIRRWKPAITALVFDSDPVAFFFPQKGETVEAAKSAQAYYHWLFHEGVERSDLTVLELADLVAQHGKAYTRQGWEYRTERKARVVRSDALFPGGIQAQLDQVNQIAAQQASQTQDGTSPPQVTAEQLVYTTLLDEYGLDQNNPNEAEQLQTATAGLLQGKPYVRVIYEEVVSDRPSWRALSPLDVLVPPRTEDVSQADYIAIVHRMTADDILKMTRDGFFRAEAAQEVVERLQQKGTMFESEGHDFADTTSLGKRSLTQLLDQVEGLEETFDAEDPKAPVWEIYTKLDINGDGIKERVILWYFKDSKTILSLMEYPFPFHSWPIVEFNFEWTSKRPYGSRGIAELLSSFQRQVNRSHNSRLDAGQIVLSPMLKVRAVGQQFKRNIKYRPGGQIPVGDTRDVEPLAMDMRGLVELLREEQLTKSLAEQFIGVFDASLTQLGGTGRERRTATEVEAVVSQISSVFAQDARMFQLSMRQVHKQLWDLEEEFGQEQVYFRVTGEEKPRTALKSEISGDYDIVPAGQPTNTNRTLMLNRAREMIQLILPLQSPWINQRELLKHYFDVMDRTLGKTIVLSEEDGLMQLQAAMAQIQEQVGQGATNGALARR